MKILFVLENLTSSCGANITIILELVKKLNPGNELFALTREDDTIPLSSEKGIFFDEVFRFEDMQSKSVDSLVTNPRWNSLSNYGRIGYLLINPVKAFYSLDLFFFENTFTQKKYKENIEKICKEKNIDAVVAVAMPYFIMCAVSAANITSKKIALQLDPYYLNHSLPDFMKKIRLNREKKVLSKFNCVLAATIVANEMHNYLNHKLANKVYPFEIPGIKKPEEQTENCPIYHTDKINCVFMGNFYRDIRSPDFLLKLFVCLPDCFILHIVGKGAENVVCQYASSLGSRLKQYGWIDSYKAMEMLQSADFMINLNNSVSNQLPSKLFQYISLGKPIINICKIANCPSLSYISKYDNALTIFEKEKIELAAEKVIAFTKTNKEKKLSWETIENVYKKNSFDYAASCLNNAINESVER